MTNFKYVLSAIIMFNVSSYVKKNHEKNVFVFSKGKMEAESFTV